MSSTRDVAWSYELATVDEVVAAGVKRRTVNRRVHNGWWLEPFPGVVCRTNGQLSPDQWRTAALLYAGPGSMLSCATAGAFWSWTAAPPRLHVTAPQGRHVRSTSGVRVHQSMRSCTPRLVEDWWVTPPARTAVDMSLELSDIDAVRALFGRAVQSGRTSLLDIADELDRAPSRGSRLPRDASADIARGAHAASEARLVRLVVRSSLPAPEYNAAVSTAAGTKYVDALWRELGKGIEIDGAFHRTAGQWVADLARQNAIQSTGIVLLRIPAYRLWREPAAVLAEIAAFLAT